MKERRKFSEEQKQQIIAKIDERVANGERIKAAALVEGITDNSYYVWKARGKKPAVKPEPKKMNSPSLITMPLDSDLSAPSISESRMVILIGNTKDVNAALDKLARVGG